MPITAEKKKTWDEFIAGFESTLDPEKFQVLKTAFADDPEKAIDYGAQKIMNMSDFNKKGQDNLRLKEKLEADVQKVLDYEKRLGEWEAHLRDNVVSREEYEEAQKQITLLNGYKAKVESQLQELGLDTLFDAEDSQTANSTITPTTTTAAANGGNKMPTSPNRAAAQNGTQSQNQNPEKPSRYVTELEFQDGIVKGVVGSALSQAQLFDLNNEYRQLTGKDIPNATQLIKEAVQAGRPLEEHFREKLEFTRLREEKTQKGTEEKIEARVKEEVAKRVSENKLPYGSAPRSPYTNLGEVLKRDSANKPVQPRPPGEGAQRATQAYYEGKYRNDNSGSSII